MSKASLNSVLDRIKTATERSPIAVFRTQQPDTYNAVFGATIHTQNLIKANDPDFIGLYHAGMNTTRIMAELLTRK